MVEAFACGVAVVASDSCEVARVVGDAGTVVPEGDTALWTAELTGLLTDPGRRVQLVQRDQERAQQLTATSLAARYASFYRSLAAHQR
jgi:glycosyltransferase involved in cell wall biosynthesis